jgi:hypothetical protein
MLCSKSSKTELSPTNFSMQNPAENPILYQETNPYSSMTAFLEDDGRTVYLYLQSQFNPGYKMQSVWVKNRVPAPDTTDLSTGMAPVLSKTEVVDPYNISPISVEDVHFIWLEEGNGVALFVKEKLCAFLPPWSGVQGFHGYSANAKIEATTAHPLGNPDYGVLADRIAGSRKFWEFRAEKDSWSKIQSGVLSHLEAQFGSHTQYWSADGGKFPIIGIAKFRTGQLSIYSTVGMSAQNMPCVELFVKNYQAEARIELVIAIQEPTGNLSETWAPHFIGELVKYPWNMQNWFGEGHSISLPKKDPLSETEFDHLVFVKKTDFSQIGDQKIEMPRLEGFVSADRNPVNFLFLIPILEEERLFLVDHGFSELLALANEKALGWVHQPDRDSLL